MWDAVIERLGDIHALSLDMRGHGRSGGGPIDHWRVFASDVASVLRSEDISGAVGIGHSMGGHALLQAAADNRGMFRRLVLFDPVVLDPDFYADAPLVDPADHPVARRKADFADEAALRDRFADRDPYRLFEPRVFADYCSHALEQAPGGQGMQLACSPLMEASVYAASRSNGAIIDAAARLDIPVLVVRAQNADGPGFQSSPTWPNLAAILPQGRDLHRPDMTHFHPYQDPGDAAAIISGWIAD